MAGLETCEGGEEALVKCDPRSRRSERSAEWVDSNGARIRSLWLKAVSVQAPVGR